ncbi:MAG: PD-(D/E)XK nuclease family protein [Lachnospiraceae bacterium]|nr:PD-(D/E)XK nuclease family protein [Lachnospiraceae bacterium]
MALQFWFGASGAGKSTGVQEKVIEEAIQNPDKNYFMIVPDQFTMQTQKQMVKMHPDGGILNIDVLSFGRLSHRIFEEVGRDDRLVLDDTGKCLLLRKVAEAEKEHIPVLAVGLKKPGYIQEVKSVLSEFMQYGLKPEDVEKLSEYSEHKRPLYLKLKDLSHIYRAFLKECEDKFITKEETLDLLTKRLKLSETVKRSTFVFDGFTGFTPIQNNVIEELMCLSENVIITLEMDHRYSPYRMEGEDFLFHLSRQTVKTLQKKAELNRIPMKDEVMLSYTPVKRFENNAELSHLERNLFREKGGIYKESVSSIQIVRAANVREECSCLCAEMFEMIAKQGYRYRDIAVVTGNMSQYEEPLRQQFEKYGVPYFMDATRDLLSNPFVAFLRNAIAVLRYGFHYTDVFRFLRSGMTDFTREEIDRLENYVRARGIKGYPAWNSPFKYAHKESKKDEKAFASINDLRAQLAGIFATIVSDSQGGVLPARKWCEVFYHFCVAQNVEKKLEDYAVQLEERNDLSGALEYRQIYRLIMDLFNQIAELLDGDLLSLQEFSDILDAGFGEIRVRTIPQGVDLLVVGDIERTRLKDIKALFFLGVNDGNIPQSSSKGGLISDMEREFLLSSGQELAPTPASQMFIEHLYLYMNITKPSEHLYLSYAVMEEDGSSKRPAYLITELDKLFPQLETKTQSRNAVILSAEDAKNRISTLLCEYVSGNLSEEDCRELFALYGDLSGREEYKEWLSDITEAAFMRYNPTDLEQKLAVELYGKILECSISSLEKFAGCHYAHFISYGLHLEEREEYGFENMDMGNVMHDILQMFGQKLVSENLDWMTIDSDVIDDFIEEAVDKVAVNYDGAILQEGAKNRYYRNQLKRIVQRSINTLQVQLQHGSFQPFAYEKQFTDIYNFGTGDGKAKAGEQGPNSPNGQLLLKGRIDRIDACVQPDEVFVKVLDYKSGQHEFDINSLYYGVSLQLAVYLSQAIKMLREKYPNKDVIPAAMLYYCTQDPIISTDKVMSPEESDKEILRALKTSGAVAARAGIVDALDHDLKQHSMVVPVSVTKDGIKLTKSVYDPVVLNKILDYAKDKTIQLAEQIVNGKIEVSPTIIGEKDSCTYCAYKDVCGFDAKIKGYEKIQPKVMNLEEFEGSIADGGEVHGGSAEGN